MGKSCICGTQTIDGQTRRYRRTPPGPARSIRGVRSGLRRMQNGDTVLYTSITYNLEGEVVNYSRIEDGQEAHYDLIAVAQNYHASSG